MMRTPDSATAPAVDPEELLYDLERLSRSFHWEIDPEGLLTRVSPVIQQVTGHRREDLEGRKSFFDFFPEELRQSLRKKAFAVFQEKQPFTGFENPMVAKDGRILWISTNGMPLLSESGELLGYRGTNTDITEQREIRETHRFLSEAVRLTDNMVMVTDPDQRIEFVNDGFERHTGYALSEVRGRKPEFLHGPDTDPKHRKAIQKGVESGKAFRQEILNYTKEGNPYWVMLDISPVRSESGEIIRFLSVGSDVTEKRELENDLERDRHFLSTVLNTTPTAVTVVDSEGMIQYANSSGIRVLGLKASEAVGKAFNDPSWKIEAVEGGPFPEEELPFTKVQKTGEPVYGIRHAIRWPNDERKILSINGAPLRKEGDRVVSTIFTISDITLEVEATRRLSESLRTAEDASGAKSRFLSTISHELRTPLNGILGMADILLMAEPDEEMRECLETIHSSGEELLTLVEKLLEVSDGRHRLEADDADSTSLTELLAALESIHKAQIHHRGIAFDQQIHGENLNAQLFPHKPILRALDLLVHNALRFGDGNRIEIHCERADSGDDHPFVRFCIRNTGERIPHSKSKRIFDPFYQMDLSNSRKHNGAGLGLTLARQIAESLGGRLELSDKPPEPFDTEFVLTVPPLKTVEDKGTTGSARHSFRILVAEDDQTNRLVIRKILEKLGHEVETAENGVEALEQLRSYRADLCLVDIEMPRLDGIEVARRFRKDPGSANPADLPIIALTAYASLEYERLSEEAGINAFLPKPVNMERLTEVIESCMQDRIQR